MSFCRSEWNEDEARSFSSLPSPAPAPLPLPLPLRLAATIVSASVGRKKEAWLGLIAGLFLAKVEEIGLSRRNASAAVVEEDMDGGFSYADCFCIRSSSLSSLVTIFVQ